jgi:hypothetical protein
MSAPENISNTLRHYQNIGNGFAEAQKAMSYADGLTSAIRRHGPFTIGCDPFNPASMPQLEYREVAGSHTVDYVRTGAHTLVYELEGTGKRYEVIVRPVPETHGGGK